MINWKRSYSINQQVYIDGRVHSMHNAVFSFFFLKKHWFSCPRTCFCGIFMKIYFCLLVFWDIFFFLECWKLWLWNTFSDMFRTDIIIISFTLSFAILINSKPSKKALLYSRLLVIRDSYSTTRMNDVKKPFTTVFSLYSSKNSNNPWERSHEFVH